MCTFSSDKSQVQDLSPTFTLSIIITPLILSQLGMMVEIDFPDDYWINQFIPSGNSELTPSVTPNYQVSNIIKTISAPSNTYKITFQFSVNSNSSVVITLKFLASKNPYYSKTSYINCKLFDSIENYLIVKATSPPNSQIPAPQPVTFSSLGSNGENIIGGINTVNVYFTQNYYLYSSNVINIQGLNIQKDATVSSVTSGNSNVLFSSNVDQSSKMIKIILNQDLAQSVSLNVIIKITNVQSSLITVINSGNISYGTSNGESIGSSLFTWKASQVASFTTSTNGITVNPSNIVGASGINFQFVFIPNFDVDSSHLFKISQYQPIEIIKSINDNIVYMMGGLIASSSCTTGTNYCNFGLSAGFMASGGSVTFKWYSFVNFLSSRSAKFILEIMDSSLALMAQAIFTLDSFIPSTISDINLIFSNPSGNYNKVLQTTEYSLSFIPSTQVLSIPIIVIYLPSGFSLPSSNLCSNPSVICSSQDSPSAIIYNMTTSSSLAAGSRVSDIKFNLINPQCAGTKAYNWKIETYNFLISDSVSKGYLVGS